MHLIKQDSKQHYHTPSSKGVRLAIFIICFAVMGIVISVLETTVVEKVITSKTNKLFPKEYYDFYKKYYKTVNHLRGISEFSSRLDFPTPESMIYNKVGNGRTKILIQGDSWAEQIDFSESSFEQLKDFAKFKDAEFISAGTTSYSPSLMTAQLELLRHKFSISAENIVSIIDQTDIGDELCRYKDKRVRGKSGLEILPFNESDPLEVYNLSGHFSVVDILHSDNFNLVKLILVARDKLAHFFKTQKKVNCPWQEISKPLRLGLNIKDSSYMKNVLEEYIETVFLDLKVKNLFVVTVPHKGHLDNSYKFDILELLEIVIAESPFKDKITIIRIEDRTLLQYYRGNPFVIGDVASHLTDIAHSEILTQRILSEIAQRI